MAVAIVQTANPAGVASSSNVITYSGLSTGTASADRIILVAITDESSNISSVTIDDGTSGHVAMTLLTGGHQGNQSSYIAYLLLPIGTTAEIKMNTTGAIAATANHIVVYAATGSTVTPSSNGGDVTSNMFTDPLTTGSVTVATNGGMLAVASCSNDPNPKTWANLTEDIDEDAGILRITTALRTTAGTFTATCTGFSDTGELGSLTWVIFQEATNITPSRVDLVFSKSPPDVVMSTNSSLIPDQGNLNLSLSAPNVFQTLSISPEKIDLVFSTYAPELSFSLHEPGAGNLIFSGFSPILNYGLVPSSGNLILETFAPSSSFNIIIQPGRVNLNFSKSTPNVKLFINRGRGGDNLVYRQSPVVAIEIDLYDSSISEEVTIRFWSGDSEGGGLTRTNSPMVQFDPRIFIPIEIGSGISAEQYGRPVRIIPRVGNIEFVIDETIWDILSYEWEGRVFRLYEGNIGDKFENFILVYVGRTETLTFDTSDERGNIRVTDSGFDLDKPLMEDVYPDDAIISLRGRPKPYFRGEAYSIEPTLEDEVNQTYRLSWNKSLIDIMEVRVGGIVWNEVVGTPGSGEWKGDLANGTFTLGSATLGNEVRCDARTEKYSTMDLIEEIIEEIGGEVDGEVGSLFDKKVSGAVGFYFKEAINIIDVLDIITSGCGASWEFGLDGKIKIRVLDSPDVSLDFRHSPMVELDDTNVNSISLFEIIPPAWRISVEYKRNWQPLTVVLPGVSDIDKVNMVSGGTVAEVLENSNIKIAKRKTIDVPLIKTLFVSEEDAILVRDRLFDTWGIERRVYDVVCWLDQTPEIYDTIYVNFKMIQGYFRIHSVLRSLGGGFTTLRVWGLKNVLPSPEIVTFTPQKNIIAVGTDLKITTYAPEVEWGLYGHWLFDEGSGTTVNDISGFNRDGTLSSSAMWESQVDGFILDFDGTEWIDFSAIANFDKTQPFSCFVSVTTTHVGLFPSVWIGNKNTTTEGGWVINTPLNNPSKVRVMLRTDSDPANDELISLSSVSINDGLPHRVGFTYDGSSNSSGLHLYVDGNNVGSDTGDSQITNSMLSSESLVAGTWSPPVSNPFYGRMKNLKIWVKELSVDEVSKDYEES